MVAAVDRRRVRELTQAIEAFFEARFGRDGLYLPSARLGLYLVFREWLRPGDRVLMSPVNCDVVLFTVLAAGLVPVLGPVDPRTGNLDPAAIEDATWASLHAVLTTNLYGVPDRMDVLQERCRRHRLLLVEDACHAFDSRFAGRRIGEFGDVAVSSLSKQVGGAGAIVTVAEPGRRDALARRAARELRDQSFPRARRWLARQRDRLLRRQSPRCGERLRYDAGEVSRARDEGGGLERFERWLKADHPTYRTWPPRSALRSTLERLERFEEHRPARLAGAARLLATGYALPGFRIPADSTLLRVPLFVHERARVRESLGRRGLHINYLYDPPLDLYAPALTESLPSPAAARIWSRDVLPVDPLCAERFIAHLA
jgi:dTDP-4-amino-4,6-dideoxygalactose transaminase